MRTRNALNQWNNAVAFSVARVHITNAAHKWFMARADTVTNYETLMRALEKTFTYKNGTVDRMFQMVQRVQQFRENTI